MSACLLRVQTPYFRAGAVWQKIYGIWSCVQAVQKLRWMIGQNRDTAKNALLRMDATFTFIPLQQPRSTTTGHPRFRVRDGSKNIEPRDQLTAKPVGPAGTIASPIAASHPLQDTRSTTRSTPGVPGNLTTGQPRPMT